MSVTPLDVRRLHIEANVRAPQPRAGRTVQAHPTVHHVRRLIRSGLTVEEVSQLADVRPALIKGLAGDDRTRVPKEYSERIRSVRPKVEEVAS